MYYLLISILCSVVVSILLKIAKSQKIDIEQAVAFNYISAILLCLYILQPTLPSRSLQSLPGLLFISLGVLLPFIFIIMAKAVQYAGIIKSDSVQRLSLFLPILAAFLIFHEPLTQNRLLGIIVAFFALLCLIYHPQKSQKSSGLKEFLLLLGVWLGYGTIDILFKQLAKTGSQFSSNLLMSFIIAAVLIFIYLVIKRTNWQLKNIFAGLVLGAFNFANILFYIKAHQYYASNPTLVFASMNLGVISLATILGWLCFKEKLKTINIIGILFAILAITILFYGDVFIPNILF